MVGEDFGVERGGVGAAVLEVGGCGRGGVGAESGV